MAIEQIKIELPRLYDKQHKAIFSPSRYAVIEASTKSGKTVGCLVWQAHKVLTDDKKRHHWWVAPVYGQSQIAYGRARRMFDPKLYKPNDSEMKLSFTNGATWHFKSGEKPDNLYGEDVASAVIDEATRLREEAWHAVRSTLTATKGPIRIIGNVKGRKNWAYRLARMAEAGEGDMSYAMLSCDDAISAHVIEQAEVDDAKRVLPDAVFRELYLCEPSDDEGNPFGLKAIRDCRRDGLQGTPVYFGVDLAKSIDYTVVCGLDEGGNVVQLDRFQADWQSTTKRVASAIGEQPALIDSTGVGDPIVEELSRERSNIEGFKFTSQTKQQIMEGLASALQGRDTAYSDKWLADELESFEYEYTRTGVRYSAPEGCHDDGVCAYALAIECKRRHTYTRFRMDVAEVEIGDELTEDERIWAAA